MTDLPFRPFLDDAAVRHVGRDMVGCALPRDEWTHEAHIAATTWLLLERPDIDIDREIAGLISRYNESVGGVNDDNGGYHDTITHAYVAGIRAFLAGAACQSLVDTVNAVLASPVGHRDWPLRFYSRDLLFSVAARRRFVAPDLAPLP